MPLRKPLLILQFLVASMSSIDPTNLCSTCGPGRVHTLCKYTAPSKTCVFDITQPRNAMGIGMRRYLLRAHNHLRNMVGTARVNRVTNCTMETAANMRKLSWDSQLAESAKMWADQCMAGRDECRDDFRFAVGQNTAEYWTYNPIMHRIKYNLLQWFDELKLIDLEDILNYRGENVLTTNITQIIWATTEFIGCGMAWRRNVDSYGGHIVCNYGPAGNRLGETIYKPGPPCSACGPNYECDEEFENLCVSISGFSKRTPNRGLVTVLIIASHIIAQ